MERLKPGQVWIGDECTPGIRHYVRCREDGQMEAGHSASFESGAMREQARGCLVFQPLSPGDNPRVRTIKQDIRYTARGPSQVASREYLDNWDAVFGKPAERKVGLS